MDRFVASATEVTAGDTIEISWSSTDATRVDVVDTEGRPLVVDGDSSGTQNIAIYNSTTLRIVAQGESSDAEATLAIVSTPTVAADFTNVSYAAGATSFTVRWDSLGAETLSLDIGGANVTDFPSRKSGAYEATASVAGASSVAVTVTAREGERSAERTATLPIYPGETEPNDDRGSAEPIDEGVVGDVGPGDFDVYRIAVVDGGHVRARMAGVDGSCTAFGALQIEDASGTVVAVASGRNDCATIAPDTSPGNRDLPEGAYYVIVRAAEPTTYFLEVESVAPSCGNDVIESRAGEHCEPSTYPELCRADCTADVIEEMEPNDRTNEAQPITIPALVAGRADTPRNYDTDVYAFELTAPTRLSIAVTGPDLSGCEYVLDGVALLRETGQQIVESEIDHLGTWCGRLEGHEAGELPAGRYLIRVRLLDLEGPRIPRYFLHVNPVEEPVCGNDVRDPGEECDDGNTRPGDGCGPSCNLEVSATWSQRREPWVFEGGPLDEDGAVLIEFEMSERGVVMVDVWTPEDGRCDGPDDDLRIRLDGVVVGDDSGVGRCPGLDTFIDVAGPPETHQLIIEPATGRAGPFVVVGRINPTERVCGDLLLTTTSSESCDDGDLVSGDGCSETCQLEPMAIAPIEASTELAIPELPRRGSTIGYPLSLPTLDSRITFEPLPYPDGFCADSYELNVFDDGYERIGGRGNFRTGDCARSSLLITDPGSFFVGLRNNARTPISPFTLDVDIADPTCGDGVWTTGIGEACDDGNLTAGDGCDPQCALETVTAEVEPNDDTGSATPFYVRTSSIVEETAVIAGHQRPGDPSDFYIIDNNGGGPMWLDVTVERDMECDAYQIFRVYDAMGALVAEFERGAVVRCVRLSPTDTPEVAALAPGRYYLEVVPDRLRHTTYFLHGRFGSGVFQ